MNISSISKKTFFGKLLRLFLNLIPNSTILPILQGRLKGKKWVVGSSAHGYWLGSYEYNKRIIIEKMIKEGTIFYDIGAHVGFYTLLASLLVGNTGKVVAFEPVARNIYYLKKHMKINYIKNVTLIEAAVCDQNGFVAFDDSIRIDMGEITPLGKLQVKAVSLDTLFVNGDIPIPQYMKIDVEGAELSVIKGAKLLIDDYHPIIFLSTHGSGIHKECCKFLKDKGYMLRSVYGNSIEESDELIATYDSV